ncbi:MAG TPA: DUF1844 domain-containing protein [Candidatus Acidoferrales bacterium]|nr:DUF1844 domain-containing protein [Candidatus Acidoferrales bacterium]
MAEPKNEESFRVVDRRLFTSEGELRPEIAEQQTREQSKPQPVSPPQASKSEKPAAPAPGSQQTAAHENPPIKPDKNFQLLIDLLARNAAALLGGIPDPATGQAYLDLEGAREMIDMLDVLREKTRGNLAAEEESLLSEVLGSLKLSYMEISKAAAKKMREGAKGAR